MTMNTKQSLFVLNAITMLTIGGIAGCTNTGGGAATPTGWREIQARHVFTLWLPPNYQEVPVQGVDSYVRMFRSDRVDLHFGYGYGKWNDPLNYPEMPAYMRTDVTVDGRKGCIVTFDREPVLQGRFHKTIALDIPRIHLLGTRGASLWADCVDAAGQDEVRQIINTISFR